MMTNLMGMTAEQIAKAVDLALAGVVMPEIAARLELDEYKLRVAFGKMNIAAGKSRYNGRCIYKGLGRWLRANGTRELAKMAGMHVSHVNEIAAGKSISKRTIDKILKATGMTYEECFAEEEESHVQS